MRAKRLLLLGPSPPPTTRHGCVEAVWHPALRPTPIEGSSQRLLELLPWADTVAFTSPRAAGLLAQDAKRRGVYGELVERLGKKKLAAIGPSTAKALQETLGVRPQTPTQGYNSWGLAALLESLGARRVAAARSRERNTVLRKLLAEKGIELEEVEVYRLEANPPPQRLLEEADAILVSSTMIARLACPRLPQGTLALVFQGPVLGAAQKMCTTTNIVVVHGNTYAAALREAARHLCSQGGSH